MPTPTQEELDNQAYFTSLQALKDAQFLVDTGVITSGDPIFTTAVSTMQQNITPLSNRITSVTTLKSNGIR